MKEDKLTRLRSIGICGTLDFALVASNAEAYEFVAQTLSLPAKVLTALIDGLHADAIFIRLAEVKEALQRPL